MVILVVNIKYFYFLTPYYSNFKEHYSYLHFQKLRRLYFRLCTNLNTSLIIVQPSSKVKKDLNTSHVNVQPPLACLHFLLFLYLNTSHVNVQPLQNQYSLKFKIAHPHWNIKIFLKAFPMIL